MEAVNERILPLLSMEIQTRKTEIIHQLDEFFKSFLKFEDKNRVLPATMLMGIYCPKTNAASDVRNFFYFLGSWIGIFFWASLG